MSSAKAANGLVMWIYFRWSIAMVVMADHLIQSAPWFRGSMVYIFVGMAKNSTADLDFLVIP